VNTTTDHTAPAELVETLERIGLTEMLSGYVPRAHIVRRVNWHEFERYVRAQGYQVALENGNLYGRVGLRPATAAPKLRVVTRSDVAAVHGSRRAA
jgi:hypothetical protein